MLTLSLASVPELFDLYTINAHSSGGKYLLHHHISEDLSQKLTLVSNLRKCILVCNHILLLKSNKHYSVQSTAVIV